MNIMHNQFPFCHFNHGKSLVIVPQASDISSPRYILRTCPPTHICGATREFDLAVRDLEAPESIVGGPLSDWSWFKASLPSMQPRRPEPSAALHSPAAFLSSSLPSISLVESMLGYPSGTYISPLTSLASSAAHPEWLDTDDVDILLRQKSLSAAIDEALQQKLVIVCSLYSCP